MRAAGRTRDRVALAEIRNCFAGNGRIYDEFNVPFPRPPRVAKRGLEALLPSKLAMPGNAPHIETEVKLAMPAAAHARRRLRLAGLRVHRRRTFESNVLYDTPNGELRSSGCLLRLRAWGGQFTVTYKAPALGRGPHKERQEMETSVANPAVLGVIFERLGLRPYYRYEKFRAEYRMPGLRGTAALDETPLGVFVELEGPPAWIDRIAARMGFGPEDYITASYATLYEEDCRRRRVEPGDMVFDPPGVTPGIRVSTWKKST
jgi:adenylate cyclase class 2